MPDPKDEAVLDTSVPNTLGMGAFRDTEAGSTVKPPGGILSYLRNRAVDLGEAAVAIPADIAGARTAVDKSAQAQQSQEWWSDLKWKLGEQRDERGKWEVEHPDRGPKITGPLGMSTVDAMVRNVIGLLPAAPIMMTGPAAPILGAGTFAATGVGAPRNRRWEEMRFATPDDMKDNPTYQQFAQSMPHREALRATWEAGNDTTSDVISGVTGAVGGLGLGHLGAQILTKSGGGRLANAMTDNVMKMSRLKQAGIGAAEGAGSFAVPAMGGELAYERQAHASGMGPEPSAAKILHEGVEPAAVGALFGGAGRFINPRRPPVVPPMYSAEWYAAQHQLGPKQYGAPTEPTAMGPFSAPREGYPEDIGMRTEYGVPTEPPPPPGGPRPRAAMPEEFGLPGEYGPATEPRAMGPFQKPVAARPEHAGLPPEDAGEFAAYSRGAYPPDEPPPPPAPPAPPRPMSREEFAAAERRRHYPYEELGSDEEPRAMGPFAKPVEGTMEDIQPGEYGYASYPPETTRKVTPKVGTFRDYTIPGTPEHTSGLLEEQIASLKQMQSNREQLAKDIGQRQQELDQRVGVEMTREGDFPKGAATKVKVGKGKKAKTVTREGRRQDTEYVEDPEDYIAMHPVLSREQRAIREMEAKHATMGRDMAELRNDIMANRRKLKAGREEARGREEPVTAAGKEAGRAEGETMTATRTEAKAEPEAPKPYHELGEEHPVGQELGKGTREMSYADIGRTTMHPRAIDLGARRAQEEAKVRRSAVTQEHAFPGEERITVQPSGRGVAAKVDTTPRAVEKPKPTEIEARGKAPEKPAVEEPKPPKLSVGVLRTKHNVARQKLSDSHNALLRAKNKMRRTLANLLTKVETAKEHLNAEAERPASVVRNIKGSKKAEPLIAGNIPDYLLKPGQAEARRKYVADSIRELRKRNAQRVKDGLEPLPIPKVVKAAEETTSEREARVIRESPLLREQQAHIDNLLAEHLKLEEKERDASKLLAEAKLWDRYQKGNKKGPKPGTEEGERQRKVMEALDRAAETYDLKTKELETNKRVMKMRMGWLSKPLQSLYKMLLKQEARGVKRRESKAQYIQRIRARQTKLRESMAEQVVLEHKATVSHSTLAKQIAYAFRQHITDFVAKEFPPSATKKLKRVTAAAKEMLRTGVDPGANIKKGREEEGGLPLEERLRHFDEVVDKLNVKDLHSLATELVEGLEERLLGAEEAYKEVTKAEESAGRKMQVELKIGERAGHGYWHNRLTDYDTFVRKAKEYIAGGPGKANLLRTMIVDHYVLEALTQSGDIHLTETYRKMALKEQQEAFAKAKESGIAMDKEEAAEVRRLQDQLETYGLKMDPTGSKLDVGYGREAMSEAEREHIKDEGGIRSFFDKFITGIGKGKLAPEVTSYEIQLAREVMQALGMYRRGARARIEAEKRAVFIKDWIEEKAANREINQRRFGKDLDPTKVSQGTLEFLVPEETLNRKRHQKLLDQLAHTLTSPLSPESYTRNRQLVAEQYERLSDAEKAYAREFGMPEPRLSGPEYLLRKKQRENRVPAREGEIGDVIHDEAEQRRRYVVEQSQSVAERANHLMDAVEAMGELPKTLDREQAAELHNALRDRLGLPREEKPDLDTLVADLHRVETAIETLQNEMRELYEERFPEAKRNEMGIRQMLNPAADLRQAGSLPEGAFVSKVTSFLRKGDRVYGIRPGKGLVTRAIREHFADMADKLVGDVDVVAVTADQMSQAARERGLKPDVPAFYDVASDRIFITKEALAGPNRGHILGHEIGHPLIESAAQKFPEVAKRLDEMRAALKEAYTFNRDIQALLGRDPHGLMDLHEFFSELWNNPNFAEALHIVKTTPAQRRSWRTEDRTTALAAALNTIKHGLSGLMWQFSKKRLLNDATIASMDIMQRLQRAGRERPYVENVEARAVTAAGKREALADLWQHLTTMMEESKYERNRKYDLPRDVAADLKPVADAIMGGDRTAMLNAAHVFLNKHGHTEALDDRSARITGISRELRHLRDDLVERHKDDRPGAAEVLNDMRTLDRDLPETQKRLLDISDPAAEVKRVADASNNLVFKKAAQLFGPVLKNLGMSYFSREGWREAAERMGGNRASVGLYADELHHVFVPFHSTADTIIHEIGHGATSQAIDKYPVFKDTLHNIIDHITALPEYKRYLDAATDINDAFLRSYAFEGGNRAHEYIAEFWANKDFRNFLRTLKVPDHIRDQVAGAPNMFKATVKLINRFLNRLVGGEHDRPDFAEFTEKMIEDIVAAQHGMMVRGELGRHPLHGDGQRAEPDAQLGSSLPQGWVPDDEAIRKMRKQEALRAGPTPLRVISGKEAIDRVTKVLVEHPDDPDNKFFLENLKVFQHLAGDVDVRIVTKRDWENYNRDTEMTGIGYFQEGEKPWIAIPAGAPARTIVHELAHAATVRALNEHPEFADSIAAIARFIQDRPLYRRWHDEFWADHPYGFTNAKEFVAEFYSNPDFRKMLSQMNLEHAETKVLTGIMAPKKHMFQLVTDLIAKTLSTSWLARRLPGLFAKRQNVERVSGAMLRDLLAMQEKNPDYEHLTRAGAWDAHYDLVPARAAARALANTTNPSMPSPSIAKLGKELLHGTSEIAKEVAFKATRAGGPGGLLLRMKEFPDLARIGDTVTQGLVQTISNLRNQRFQLQKDILNRGGEKSDNATIRAAAEYLSTRTPEKIEQLANYIDAENYGQVHGNHPLDQFDADGETRIGPNKHVGDEIGSRQMRARHGRAEKLWDALDSDQQDLVVRLKEFYASRHEEMRTSDLRRLIEAGGMVNHGHAEATDALVRNFSGEKLTEDETKLLAEHVPGFAGHRDASDRTVEQEKYIERAARIRKSPYYRKVAGPYYPMMRRGNWVVRGKFNVGHLAEGGVEVEPGHWEFETPEARARFIDRLGVDENPDLKVMSTSNVAYEPDPADPKRILTADGKPVRAGTSYTNPHTGVLHETRPQPFDEALENGAHGRYRVEINPEQYELHDTERLANVRLQELQQDPNFTGKAVEPRKENISNYIDPSYAMQSMNDIVNDVKRGPAYTRLDAGERAHLDREWMEAAERHMLTQSGRSRYMKRKSTLGSSQDLMNNLYTYSHNTSHTLAETETRNEMRDALKALDEHVRSSTEHKYGTLRSQIQQEVLHRMGLRPETYTRSTFDKVLNVVMKLVFLDKLGSPSWLALNGMEPGTVAGPLLAGAHGAPRAYAALTRAYATVGALTQWKSGFGDMRRIWRAGLNGDPQLTDNLTLIKDRIAKSGHADAPELVKMIETISKNGYLDRDAGMELAKFYQPNASTLMRTIDFGDNLLRAINSQMENVNRSSVAVAAYRLAREDGMDHDKATAYAQQKVHESAGNYAAHSQSPLMANKLFRPALQFKKYSARITANWLRMLIGTWQHIRGTADDPVQAKIAAKQLVANVASVIMTAGMLGLPTEPLKLMLLAGGFNTEEVEGNIRAWMADAIGQDAAEILMRGLPRYLGTGLGQRTALDSLWTYGSMGSGKDAPYASLGHLMGGPAAGQIFEAYTGIMKMASGTAAYFKDRPTQAHADLTEGLRLVVPFKLLADTIGTYRDATVPKLTRAGQQMGPEPDAATMISNVLGIRTGPQLERAEASTYTRTRIKSAQDYRNAEIAAYVHASTPGEKSSIRKQILANNADYGPESQINLGDLLKAEVAFHKKGTLDPNLLGVTLNRRNRNLAPSQAVYGLN